MTHPVHILFASNYAGRSGAPMVLLTFQRWLKARQAAEFSTVFGAGGPLWAEFDALGPTWMAPHFPGARLPPVWSLFRRITGIRRWPHWAARLGWGRREVLRADVIHANTAATAREVLWLSRFGRPIVWHLHELASVIEAVVDRRLFENALRLCRRIAVVSNSMVDLFQSDFGIDPQRLELVPEFIRRRDWTPGDRRRARSEFRRTQGWGEDDWIVGGCGQCGWRKGSDLFVTLARAFLAKRPDAPVRFAWIGGGDGIVLNHLHHDVRRAGLEDRCRFVGELPDASERVAAFDLLAVPSREDPYPLVMLEAAAAGVPMIGFEQSGGPAEFARAGAGRTVPYLDIAAFVGELVQLYEDRPSVDALGRQAADLVRQRHDVEVQAPRLLSLLHQAAEGSGRISNSHPGPSSCPRGA